MTTVQLYDIAIPNWTTLVSGSPLSCYPLWDTYVFSSSQTWDSMYGYIIGTATTVQLTTANSTTDEFQLGPFTSNPVSITVAAASGKSYRYLMVAAPTTTPTLLFCIDLGASYDATSGDTAVVTFTGTFVSVQAGS